MKSMCYLIFISLIGNSFISCAGENITRSTETPTGIFENIEYARSIEVNSPGSIHNEILIVFCKSHKPLSGNKLPAPEFARLVVDSANEVFEKNNIEIRINERDIAIILKGFWGLKKKGVMDVFKPTREGLHNTLNYAAEICGSAAADSCPLHSQFDRAARSVSAIEWMY